MGARTMPATEEGGDVVSQSREVARFAPRGRLIAQEEWKKNKNLPTAECKISRIAAVCVQRVHSPTSK